MSGNISLCSFCRFIPLDVDTLEELRSEARPRSTTLGRSRFVLADGSWRTESTKGGRAVFALGNAERVLSSDCPFCKITAIAVRDIKRAMGWHGLNADTPLKLTWSHNGPGSKGVFQVNDKDNIYICFAEESCAGRSMEDPSLSAACIICPAQALLDASRITKWITNCQRLHGPECNAHDGIAGPVKETYRGLELIRFVDVHKRCIVERREVVKYVTLSYVWGAAATLRLTTTNQWQMRIPGALANLKLPATIIDAIDVTRACGEQYLWVDALCIVQNDADDLEAGTYAMDLIYEMSVFTIVAASGSDAGQGLPGFRVGSRLAPPCFEVSPGVRLGVLSEVHALIGASCYATRGWTLQEEMLSKRILYFVDDKVFFHCPGNTLSEDCDVTLRWHPNGSLKMLEPVRNYKSLVKAYSSRVLTTQNDAFRAIAGIMRRISEHQQWHIVAGMPTVALENMMLFRRRLHPLSRRPHFPSYSWLGWTGVLEFVGGEGYNLFEAEKPWHFRNPATGEILAVEFQSQVIGSTASDNIATYRDLGPRPLARVGIQINRGVSSQTSAKLYPPSTFSLLCFSTLAVFFQLENVDYVHGKADITHSNEDERQRYIGTVTLDGLEEYPVALDAEFILLSRRKPSEQDLEEMGLYSWPATQEVYAVMLIEWIDGVAERRGIGFIDAIQIKNSMAPGPIRKEIILS